MNLIRVLKRLFQGPQKPKPFRPSETAPLRPTQPAEIPPPKDKAVIDGWRIDQSNAVEMLAIESKLVSRNHMTYGNAFRLTPLSYEDAPIIVSITCTATCHECSTPVELRIEILKGSHYGGGAKPCSCCGVKLSAATLWTKELGGALIAIFPHTERLGARSKIEVMVASLASKQPA